MIQAGYFPGLSASALLTLAVFSISIRPAASAPAPVPAPLNAVWVYSVSSLPNPVTDAPTRDALVQNSSASGVNMLYVSVYSSTPNSAGRYMYDDGDIAGLIGQAHARGIQVYAAYGDTDWPALGCAASAFPMQRMAEVTAYNSANQSAMFDGVVLDVEPSGTPDFQALLELYQCFQQQAGAHGMGLSAAISAFWNTVVAFNQVTEEAYKQIVDLKLSNVVVMGYRNYAGTPDCTQGDGVVCLDEDLIAYANSTAQANSIVVGLDTDNPATSGSTAEETFFSLGQAAMNAAAQSVSSQFAAVNQIFGGFSFNNYRDSYLNGQLAGWPATNPAPPAPAAHPAFFTGEIPLGSGVYYLQLPNNNLFGYYNYAATSIFYHYDMGYEGFIPGSGADIDLFDFTTGHWLYTTAALFPYLYDFTLKAWIYYFPDTKNPGHYTMNPRWFSNLDTGQVFTM